MTNKTIILPGGSGFLGTAMAPYLRAAGYDLIVLTRGEEHQADGIRYVHWDGRTLGPWASLLDGTAAVVNLAGRSVNCRYTPENQREILQSRVDSVHALAEAIGQCSNPPRAWVQAASAAIHGNAGDQLLDESSPPGLGFSPETCIAWERAFNSVDCPRTRRVLLRIGFVLGEGGGALQTLTKLARCFLGGSVGSGQQWVSWLHVKDLTRIILWSIERDDVEGLYLAVSLHRVAFGDAPSKLGRLTEQTNAAHAVRSQVFSYL